MMKIELSKFRIKKGKEIRALEWLDFLNKRMPEVLETLEGEKMYVETIFKEYDGEHLYFYWYSIQGENGNHVEESEQGIDKLHLMYWKECIDSSYQSVDMEAVVSMIPSRVIKSFE